MVSFINHSNIKKIFKIILSLKWSFIFFLLLLVTTHWFKLIHLYLELQNTCIILSCLFIFSRIKYLNFFLAFIISLILALEITYRYTSGVAISPILLDAFFTTNITYTSQVMLPYLLKSMVPFCFLLFLSIKCILEINQVNKSIYFILLAFLLIISLYGISRGYVGRHVNLKRFIPQVNPYIILKEDQLYLKRYPLLFGNLSYLMISLFSQENLELPKNRVNILNDKIDSSQQPMKVVIVIGESSTSQHYSLYGYPYTTTPELDNLYNNNELIFFKNVIAPIPSTDISLKLTLSFSDPVNLDHFFEYKNIIDMAKLAGYQTYWLSTTYEKGINASYSSLLAQSSDIFYESTMHPMLFAKDDLVLANVLKENLEFNKKQFIILHMQGSHVPYADRIDDYDTKNLNSTPEFLDYDASIFHTDRSLVKIIDALKQNNESFIFYYFSDHGEIVNIGHGIESDDISQYLIPLVVYQYKNNLNITSLINKYKSNNGYLNLSNTSYIISEILGFKVNPKLIEEAKQTGEYIITLHKEPVSNQKKSTFKLIKAQDYLK
ncbi:phosphoethanolamine transferase [Entomomonas asaccharolytica]|uniref:Phosphoethanolamine transferase n=1 Tax=Entomomonas asaccharolytica TaxID=2785331 RepID=A0A974ND67_9GAMM|nr:phosphoethanolamine transferase [Entomomonas asaccharolytica]QQP84526.1 phosphoethanolamine transferase [Entomomonas asaccharolytica]